MDGFQGAPDASVTRLRDAQLDVMADLMVAHLDLEAIFALLDGPPADAPVIRSALGWLG